MKRVAAFFFFVLALGLAPVVSHAEGTACRVVDDPANDASGTANGYGLTPRAVSNADGAIDILALGMSSSEQVVGIDLRVRDLAQRFERGSTAVYDAAWRYGDVDYAVRAVRAGNAWRFEQAAGPDKHYVPSSGSASTVTDTVHFDLARDSIGSPADGEALTRIWASTEDAKKIPSAAGLVASGSLVLATDHTQAPSDEQSASYVVGGAAACAQLPAILCPVTSDAKGDATPGIDFRGRRVGMADGSLDLLSAGAQTTAETVGVSVRVADLGAHLPPAFDTVGWTTSWSYGGARWIAQASRGSHGVRYTYGRSDDQALSGPVFGATETAGSLDLDGGVVTIDVPREAVGAPAEADTFAALGSIAWAARVGNPTAYHVFDQTGTHDYSVGTACGA